MDEYKAKMIRILDINGEIFTSNSVWVQEDGEVLTVALNEEKTDVITFIIKNIISIEVHLEVIDG